MIYSQEEDLPEKEGGNMIIKGHWVFFFFFFPQLCRIILKLKILGTNKIKYPFYKKSIDDN